MSDRQVTTNCHDVADCGEVGVISCSLAKWIDLAEVGTASWRLLK